MVRFLKLLLLLSWVSTLTGCAQLVALEAASAVVGVISNSRDSNLRSVSGDGWSCAKEYAQAPNEKLCDVFWNQRHSYCTAAIRRILDSKGGTEAPNCKRFKPVDVIADATPSLPKQASPPIRPVLPPQKSDGAPKEARKESVLRPASSGSGFLVASDRIVTNSHVVEKCEKVVVKTPSGDVNGSILDQDPQLDLALIKVSQKLGEPIPRLKSVLLGEEVMTAGYPYEGLLSKSLKVTFGEISSLAGLRNDSTRIQISAPIQPGNSGGPVIDLKGNIAGVVVARVNDAYVMRETGGIAQNVNFAIKPEVLEIFLTANGLRESPALNTGKLTKPQTASLAEKITFQIFCLRSQ